MTTSARRTGTVQGGTFQMFGMLKRVLIGSPLHTAQLAHERLTNPKALAVFSSDALSSVAYATEEILLVLVTAGAMAMNLSLSVGLAIGALLIIVGFSYRQTIFAYPSGGGSYIVAKENLSTSAGLTAGAALLIDYVLTVAVSIAAGVAAITSAIPVLLPYRVLLCLVAIALISLANLRGVRESGNIFAIPTFIFIGTVFVLVITGFARWWFFGGLPQAPVEGAITPGSASLTTFLILRAFSSGCAALTGVEAISNGVQAFKEPVSKNAAKTLIWMVAILLSMFLGITILAHAAEIHPMQGQTVMSQLARVVFGGGTAYYVMQAATALILLLAANTSYADFPRLASLIARDGFLPRQLANRGDRLVFSNGIVVLGVLSALLVIRYHGDTHALIPLYAVGVFLSFTLSQSGMVMHWFRLRETDKHWLTHAMVNGLGALTTAVVLVVIAATKFTHGAWIVIVLIPIILSIFLSIRRHYDAIAANLRMPLTEPVRRVKHTIVVPVAGVNRMVAQTISYALSLSDDVRAVHVSIDPDATEKIKAKWEAWNPGVPLTILNSPFRSVTRPLINFINKVERVEHDDVVTVMVPEFIPQKLWHNLLHNQSAMVLKTALRFRPHTVVVSVPYHLKD